MLCTGWQSCAQAISAALHPEIRQLIRLLNSIAISTVPIFDRTQSPLFFDISSNVEQVLRLPGVDFASDGFESLDTILKSDLKWVNDEQQFASRWNQNNRVLRQQLPEIRKAITQWQHNVLSQWEATGYRHDAAHASRLKDQRPVRLHLNGTFIADALDSADLACILLHPVGCVSISQALGAASTYQLTLSRYKSVHCLDLSSTCRGCQSQCRACSAYIDAYTACQEHVSQEIQPQNTCVLRSYAHKLPYALVKQGTHGLLMQAHERTTGRLLGQANHEMWAEEVVQNLSVASLLTSTAMLHQDGLDYVNCSQCCCTA